MVRCMRACRLSLYSLLHLGADLEGGEPLPVELAQGVDEVVDLRLDHEDHRAVAQAGVRPDQEEQVREAGDGRALVGLLPVSASSARPSDSPSAPKMRSKAGESVTWKPVATTIASTSRSTPSRSTIACARISAMPSVTSSTLSRASAGYQSLEIRIRLQPICQSGVTGARRSAGSLMDSAMLLLRRALGELQDLRLVGEAEHERLAAPVDGLARGRAAGPGRAVGEVLEPRSRRGRGAAAPRGGALVDVEVRDGVGDGGHDLDRPRRRCR